MESSFHQKNHYQKHESNLLEKGMQFCLPGGLSTENGTSKYEFEV